MRPALAAVVLTSLMVWLSPNYRPTPCVLRQQEMQWVEVPDVDDFEPLAPVQAAPRLPPLIQVVDDPLEADPLLDKAALAAARKCVFVPGQQRELKVPTWVAVPYNFRLR